jgi:hypothetical protein
MAYYAEDQRNGIRRGERALLDYQRRHKIKRQDDAMDEILMNLGGESD